MSPRDVRRSLVVLGVATLLCGVGSSIALAWARVTSEISTSYHAMGLLPEGKRTYDDIGPWVDELQPMLNQAFAPTRLISPMLFVMGGAMFVLAWRAGRAPAMAPSGGGAGGAGDVAQ